jgi:hypothetical protein
MVDSRPTVLPWTLQDNWGFEQAPTTVPTVVIENDVLEVTVIPGWGGKIHSIRHKPTDTQLVYANSIHQPLNGGVRKAWSAGGIEWNWSPGMIGHSAFTEAPVHVARVPSPQGDAIRIWEFDRFNSTIFQVDLLLTNSSADGTAEAQNALWIHGKLLNTRDSDLRGYWWTNTAVATTPDGRVLSPARGVATCGVCQVSCAPFPVYSDPCVSGSATPHANAEADAVGVALNRSSFPQYDHSVVGHLVQERDDFLRVRMDDPALPPQMRQRGTYVAHTDGDIYGAAVGSFHGTRSSSARNGSHSFNGTKFFTWGANPQGRFWTKWLGHAEGQLRSLEGNYIELQTGMAPTQMQAFAFGPHDELHWSEWILGMSGANRSLLSMPGAAGYAGAQQEVARWLGSADGLATATIDAVEAELEALSARPIAEQLSVGSPWGALEQLRRHSSSSTSRPQTAHEPPPPSPPLSPSAPFHEPEGGRWSAEGRPWAELLINGSFSASSRAVVAPSSFMVAAEWVALMEHAAAMEGGRDCWLLQLHLGVAMTEAEFRADGLTTFPRAREHFERSMDLRPNPVAARCLATTSRTAMDAWAMFNASWVLACQALTAAERQWSADAADHGGIDSTGSALNVASALAEEVARFLLQNAESLGGTTRRNELLTRFVASVDAVAKKGAVAGVAALAVRDSVILAKATLAMASNDTAAVRETLRSSRFPTFWGARSELSRLWMEAAYHDAWETQRGAAGTGGLSAVQRHHARLNAQLPASIGPFVSFPRAQPNSAPK